MVYGTAFHRNTPWFGHSRSFIRYLQHCHLILRQGEPAADTALYIGDFVPQMTGPKNPARVSARYKIVAMPTEPATQQMRHQVRGRIARFWPDGGRWDARGAECERSGGFVLHRLPRQTSRRGSVIKAERDGQPTIAPAAEPLVITDGWTAVPCQEAPNTLTQEVVFNLPEALAKAGSVKFDLGQVNVMATVTLNGKEFESLWMPPFELDVTKALHSGQNRLRVQVVSIVPTQPAFGPEVRLKPVLRAVFK